MEAAIIELAGVVNEPRMNYIPTVVLHTVETAHDKDRNFSMQRSCSPLPVLRIVETVHGYRSFAAMMVATGQVELPKATKLLVYDKRHPTMFYHVVQ